MKAMIFAAGLGTRLRPLTDHMPKALVPVAGKPMLERVILRLKEAGFNEITVNIHHFGEQIIDFLRAHDNFGTEIHISDERGMLLDTGGGIKKARPFLDGQEPFLVHNADILTDIDLAGLYRHHLESDAESTLLVSERKTSRYPPARLDKQVHRRGETGRLRLPGNEVPGTRLRRYPHHLPLPLPPDGRWAVERQVLHHSFLLVRLHKGAHTRLSAARIPLVRHRQTGDTDASGGILQTKITSNVKQPNITC